MGLVPGFRDGFVFVCAEYFIHQGAYTCIPRRPVVCDKCRSDSGAFHAHGRYRRWLITLSTWALRRIRIWKHRWLCLCCGRTMSTGPPDVLPYMRLCTLVIVALLWTYLDGHSGMHTCIPQELEGAAEPRTLARHLRRAKAVCLETQQVIREVLLEIKEPRPWDECFAEGLSPPERLTKRHREPSPVTILWRALAMLLIGSETLSTVPCLLMARAQAKAEHRTRRFLL